MFIDPNIGDSINISGRQYAFAETPGAPGVIYAEIGRKAKVYRLICDHQPFALKAFKPKYRIPETVENSSHIARLQGVDGLAVAQRHILTPIDNPDVVRFNEAFAYSVLMPWVEGYSWFNYITGRLPLEPAHSLRLARAFIHSVWQLEQRDLAHCDLSSSNFIFSPDFLHVELIDIEDMFGIGLIPPKEKPKGTGGYAPAWIKTDGVWEAAGDRFSAGILVSEILAWQFADVRAASNGDAYFAEDEFGHKSARFHLMGQRLAQIHPELSRLFKTVWYAESLEECPRISDWKRVLDAIQEPSLEVDPDFLELGTLDLRTKPAAPLHASFTIGNVGGGLLEGRIISNVSWLAVRPSQFSCPAGTVTDHEVILIAKPPHSKSQKHYTLTNAISVQSNQRVQMLSGTYSIIAPLVSPLQWLLRAGAFLVLMIGAYFIIHPQPQPPVIITPQPSSAPAATMLPTATRTTPPTPTETFEGVVRVNGQDIRLQKISIETAARLEPLTNLETGTGIKDILFSPDSLFIAIVRKNGSIQVWDAVGMNLIDTYETKTGIGAVAFGVNKLLFATCGDANCVSNTGSKVLSWQIAPKEITEVGTYPQFVIGLSADGKAVLGKSLGTFTGTQWNNNFPNKNYFNKYRFELWDLESSPPSVIKSLVDVNGTVGDSHPIAVISPDGKDAKFGSTYSSDGKLEAHGYGKQVAIVGVDGQTILVPDYYHQTGHTGRVNDVAFSADDAMLASSASDGTIMLWQVSDRAALAEGAPVATLKGPAMNMTVVAFSPSGYLLVSGATDDAQTTVWVVR